MIEPKFNRHLRYLEGPVSVIDDLVYELYGLSEDEIKIVEEGTGKG